MAKRYVIDRARLPYDAMVGDESWLVPVEEDDADGNKGTDAETDGTEETGRDTGQEAAQ